MAVTVETGPRLHCGFLNLSPQRDRLFGSVGVGVDRPLVRVRAAPAEVIDCEHAEVADFARSAVSVLDVPGAQVSVTASPPRHVGFGTGTQLALATLVAIAAAYDETVDVRATAPRLGRGGRSGIGVATFERGGFVMDAGHARPAHLTVGPPDDWTVPPVVLRRPLPATWRFVAVLPAVEPRIHGTTEDRSIERVMRSANPAITDRIARVVLGELLPAVATADLDRFGAGLARIDQLNGLWFRGEQSEAYHPSVRPVAEDLAEVSAVTGVGQSSWGPTVYGLTTAAAAEEVETAAAAALDRAGLEGEVLVLCPRNKGATIIEGNNQRRNINLPHSAFTPKWTE